MHMCSTKSCILRTRDLRRCFPKSYPSKAEAGHYLPPPKSVKDVRDFLWLVAYYRRFAPGFATVATSLTGFSKQDYSFNFGPVSANGLFRR